MAVQLAGWPYSYLEALCAQPRFGHARAVTPLWLAAEGGPAEAPAGPAAAPLTIQMAAEVYPRLVLVGPAGSGKTTALRQLALGLAEALLVGRPQPGRGGPLPLPLYVELAHFPGTVEGALAAEFGVGAPPLDELAQERPLLFLLDGLDELAPETQLASLSTLAHALAGYGAQARWIASCRSEHLALFRPWLGGAEVRALQPLRPRDVTALAQRELGDAAADWLARSDDLLNLATRPRWLAALLAQREALADTPGRGRLLAAWLPTTITMALSAHPRPATPAQVIEALPEIAGALDQRAAEALPLADAVTAVELAGLVPGAQARPGAVQRPTDPRVVRATTGQAALDALVDAGVLALDAERRVVMFRHPTLRSFAQAMLLARSRPDSWPPAILGRSWVDAVIFAYSLCDDREAALRRLLASGAVGLTARCLIDAEPPEQYDALLERSGSLTPPLRMMLADAFAAEGLRAAALEQLERAGAEGYDEAALFGRLGDLYGAGSQWLHARMAYEQALAREPGDLRYRQQLGVVCSRLGENEQAALALEAVLEAHRRHSAEAAHELGHVYQRLARAEQALAAYRQAADAQPGDPSYARSVAGALRGLGRYAEAETLLGRLLADHGGDADAHAELGRLYAATGRAAQAAASLSRAVALRPGDAQLYAQLGRLRRTLGDLPGARAALQRAAEIDANDATLQFELAQVFEACGEPESALAACRAAVRLDPQADAYLRQLGALLRDRGDEEGAAQALRTALELRPDSADTFGELADLLWRTGRREQALDAYRRARQLAPHSADHACALGLAYRRLGRARDAERTLREAAGLAPERAELHYEAGAAAAELEQWAAALDAFGQAVALDPGRPEYARAAGALQLQMGDRARARTLLALALRRARRDPETLFQVGLLHGAAGVWPRAVAALRRAVRYGASARYEAHLGGALLELGRADEACAAFERALRTQPDDPHILDGYSVALEARGQLEAAYNVARQAARLAAGSAAVQQRAGGIALRLGRLNEALALLDRATALDSRLAEAHANRACALLTLGRPEAALAAALSAQALDPDAANVALLAGSALVALGRDPEAAEQLERAAAADPTLIDAHAALRDLRARAGQIEAALAAARRAAALAPGEPAHRLRLGALLLDSAQLEAARRELEVALDLGGDRPQSYALLSRLHGRAGDRAGAVAHARAAADLAPGQGVYRALLAEALEAAGDLPGALAELSAAAEQEPERADWQLSLGQLHRRAGDDAAALPFLRRAALAGGAAEHYALGSCLRSLGDLHAAAEAIETALRLQPDPAWRAELALVHFARGWHGEALAELSQAVAASPELPGVWRARAEAQLAVGQIDGARADLVEALRRDPADALSYALLAGILADQGSLERALEAARRAVALQPSVAAHRRTLARALRGLGRRHEAAEQLTHALASGGPAAWWAELAEDREALGELEPARSAWAQAVAVAPDDAALRLRYGDLLARLGDLPAAAEQLRLAIARRPGYAAAHARLADVLLGQADDAAAAPAEPAADPGDADGAQPAAVGEAVAAGRMAVAIAPQQADHWRALGAALRAEGALAEAAHALRRAHELDPSSAPVAFLLGLTLLESGDPAAAIPPLSAAVAAAPAVPAYHAHLGLAQRRLAPLGETPDELQATAAEQRATLTQARRTLVKAIALDPGAPRWWFELGLADQQLGRHAQACEAFSRALALLDGQGSSAGDAPATTPPQPTRAELLRRRAHSHYLAARLPEACADLEAIPREAAEPADAYLLGRALLEQGEPERARPALEAALAGDDDHAPARLLLGQALLALGEPKEAISALERASDQRSDHAPTAAALSDAYAAAGRHERAVAAAQRAVRLDPGAAAHHQRLAHLYATAGRLHEARAALINAMTLHPGVAAWHAEMAEICLRMGMHDAARSAYQRAAQLAPEEPVFRYALARLLAQHGRPAEAREALEQAIALAPGRGAWRYELAELLLRQDDAAATEHFVAAAQLTPEEPRHWLGLAQALRARGDTAAAAETVERALLRFGDDPALHAVAGALFEGGGDLAAALWHYEIAAESGPHVAEHWWRLGRVQLELGRQAEARAAAERALALDPAAAEAHAVLARTFASAGDGRAALVHSQRAAELRPDDAGLQVQLAEALAHLRRFDEARQALERAVQLAPNDPELLARYGELALAVGLCHEALGAFERAIGHAPEEPRYHFLAGKAHRRLKHYSRAIERFRRAIKLRPGYSDAIVELSTLGPLAFVAQHLRGDSEAA